MIEGAVIVDGGFIATLRRLIGKCKEIGCEGKMLKTKRVLGISLKIF